MRRIGLYISALAAIIVLLAAFHSNTTRAARHYEDARGCDWFGYLRQAQLFRKNGLVGGLDTAIRDDRTAYLVRVAKSFNVDPKKWDHRVSPHCHHYKPRVDRVVNQYPPGTGFVQSFFPEETQARWTQVASSLVILAALFFVIARSKTAMVPWLAIALGAFCFLGMHRYFWGRSIQPSVAFSVLIGGLTVATCLASTSSRRALSAGALGLLIGLATSMRLPNLLLAAGPAIVLGLTTLRRPWRDPAGFVLVAMIAAGLIPVLAANAVNAGHPFATTYSWTDAIPPSVWRIPEGLKFYFVKSGTDGFYFIAATAVLAVALIVDVYWRTPGIRPAIIAAAINLFVGTGYVAGHIHHFGYYLMPFSVATAATAVFCLIAIANAEARSRSHASVPTIAQVGIVAISLGIAVMLPRQVSMPVSPHFAQPSPAVPFESNSIVWADHATGAISYFLDRQAAVLPFMALELQDRFFETIDRDGVPQYVVMDSDRMKLTFERLAERHDLRLVGTTFGYDTFLIRLRL